MNKRISIIIPVYNVEKYLCQCVDSIINQSYKNFEIILVDDGSTDGSPVLCDEYAKKYDFVEVIHKANGGASDARNTGVLVAGGDYILFIDSDDFIEPRALAKVADVVNENPVDLVFLEAQKYYADGRVVRFCDGITKEAVKGKNRDDVLDFLSTCPKFSGSPCTKLIKKTLFEEFDLSFYTGIVAEDIDWCLKLITAASSFDYCEEVYYNYRQNRQGSVTNQAGKKHVGSLIFIMKKWTDKYGQADVSEKRFVYSSLAYEYTILIMLYATLDKENKREFIEDIKNLYWLLKYRTGVRYLAIKVLCKIIGFGLTSKLLKLYLKIR